jgi:hypothetical protein
MTALFEKFVPTIFIVMPLLPAATVCGRTRLMLGDAIGRATTPQPRLKRRSDIPAPAVIVLTVRTIPPLKIRPYRSPRH